MINVFLEIFIFGLIVPLTLFYFTIYVNDMSRYRKSKIQNITPSPHYTKLSISLLTVLIMLSNKLEKNIVLCVYERSKK